MAKKTKTIFQFKITLKNSKPAIWRRILVPSSYTFWDLHCAIQDAMGWLDCHLHEFHLPNCKHSEVVMGIPSEDDDIYEREVLPCWKERIDGWFKEEGEGADYWYDFGDDWHHHVRLEKIVNAEAGIKYPVCAAGKRACPPEDCGGVYGYEDLLKIISNPKHGEHEEMMEWLGGGFDPEEFNPEDVVFSDPKKRLKNLLKETDHCGTIDCDGDSHDDPYENGKELHAVLSEVVQSQLDSKNPPEAVEAYERMMAKGCPAEEAKIRIMRRCAFSVYDLMKGADDIEEYLQSLRVMGTDNYAAYPLNDLIDLLRIEEDTLPRGVVDELIKRKEEVISDLGAAIDDIDLWLCDPPDRWVVIHAFFILGAMRDERALPYLIRAIERADEFDVDWIYAVAEAVIGKQPEACAEKLLKTIIDGGNRPYVKAILSGGLAAMAFYHPEIEKDVFSAIGNVFSKTRNDALKRHLGLILLDFRRAEYRAGLIKCARVQEAMRSVNPCNIVDFRESDVIEILERPFAMKAYYEKDWLDFYDPDQIKERQERRVRENAEEERKTESGNGGERIDADFTPRTYKGNKISRNDPCPCGSGRKFKKCCIEKYH